MTVLSITSDVLTCAILLANRQEAGGIEGVTRCWLKKQVGWWLAEQDMARSAA